MIKKTTAVLLAVLFLCMAVSCGTSDSSGNDVYAAIKKTVSLDNVSSSFNIKMRMTQGFGYVDTTVSGSSKRTILDGERVEETKMNVDYGVSKTEESVIIVGDTAYTIEEGEKIKLPASYALVGVPALDLSLVDKDSIESAAVCDDGSCSIQLKQDRLNEILDILLGMERSDGNVYENVSFSVTINDDGYVTKCKLNFEMNGSDSDLGDYGATVEGEFTFDSPGSAVTIDLPDLSEYSYPDGYLQ